MKNYEILYLNDGKNFKKILLELGERTKPVMCKTTYAYEVFKSDKELDDISEGDIELTKSELIIFGDDYEVKEFAEKFPDEDFSCMAKWEPNNYKIVFSRCYKCSASAPMAIPKVRPFVCTTPKQMEWQVSAWGYELILETFKHRILS